MFTRPENHVFPMGFPMGKPPAEVLQKSIAPALMQSVTKVKHEEKPEEVMGREGGKKRWKNRGFGQNWRIFFGISWLKFRI